MKRSVFWVLCFGLVLAASQRCQAAGGTVSVEEFNKLKADYEQLKQEVQQLKQAIKTQPQPVAAQPEAPPGRPEEYVSSGEFQALKEKVSQNLPGQYNFLLSGYGFTSVTKVKRDPADFATGFNPILIWKPNEQFIFESEVEFGLAEGTTETSLEYADIGYTLNDYITLGAGKFLTPFGIFIPRYHPAWINKLSDKPFAYQDGPTQLAAEAQIGGLIHGGLPLSGDMKANYALFFSNGPTLQTGASNAGELSFDGTTNNNKAVGGRIGFLPADGLEAGYSFEFARVGARETQFSKVEALVQGVDLSYRYDSEPLRGSVELICEDILSRVNPIDYGTGQGAFNNRRQSSYVQVSYRAYKAEVPLLKDLEWVFRFDQIDQPSGAPDHTDSNRYTWGLDYWFNSRTVAKLSYEWEKQRDPKDGSRTIMGELAMGF